MDPGENAWLNDDHFGPITVGDYFIKSLRAVQCAQARLSRNLGAQGT